MKLIAPASMLLSQCFPPSACNEDMKTGRSGVFLYCSAGLCGDGQALPAPTFDVKSPPLEILHQKKAFQGRQGWNLTSESRPQQGASEEEQREKGIILF